MRISGGWLTRSRRRPTKTERVIAVLIEAFVKKVRLEELAAS